MPWILVLRLISGKVSIFKRVSIESWPLPITEGEPLGNTAYDAIYTEANLLVACKTE